MSFARNFAAGQQIAQTGIDTFKKARQNRDLGRVDDWKKSDEYEGYTEQDGAQMRAMANAKDADGNPYYEMQDDGQGGLRVQSNFSYAGADGSEVAPGSHVGLAPRQVVDYGGQRYAAQDLTPERMESLQDRERTRILGREDPELGMKLRRQMKTDERDDKRFGWEEQAQPLKQRVMEQQVSTGDRVERAGQRTESVQSIIDQVAQMPEEALKVYAAKLNSNDSQLPFLMVGENKDGYKFLSIDPETKVPTGKEFTLNSAQLREMAAASVLGMMGMGAESMNLLSGVNKDIAQVVRDMNGMTAAVVSSENDATHKGNSARNDEARLGLERRRVDIAARTASDARRAANKPHWVSMDDGKGGSVYVDMNAVGSKDGVAQLPEGVRPAGRPVDQAAVVTMATKFVEGGMKDPDDPSQPITMEKAIQVATAHARGQPYMSLQARIEADYIKAKNGGGGDKDDPETSPAAPKGRGLLTDKQGRTQLLEPFTRLNEYRKRMIENDNGNHGQPDRF